MKTSGSLCTQADMESEVFIKICEKLKHKVRYHRKLWEFVWIYNILSQKGMLKKGRKGLGFGCGKEVLVPAFASCGAKILATDLSVADARGRGWINTNQHMSASSFDHYISGGVCDLESFSSLVRFRDVDMNSIPKDLLWGEFDFVWSSCAFEHLGNLQMGIDYVLNTLECLKPGGISIHTTEFNLESDSHTLESGPTCFYRKQDILKILNEAERRGYKACILDLDSGAMVHDNYIDLPPFCEDRHLKLKNVGYVCTSIGIYIERVS